ncbi:hypothetical protein bcere0009_21800 [Bacillus cereus R309803]|nr:hypothetical protein bcere0009_21800 [Bacillus cereus R309803]
MIGFRRNRINLVSLRKKALLITINVIDSAFLLWNARGV